MGHQARNRKRFRHDGHQVWRRVGPAWLDRSRDGSWTRRRGRIEDGYFDERRANIRAAEIVAEYVRDYSERERVEYERKVQGMTFRELAHGYLDWLERVKGAKPSTLASHRLLLAEPGRPHRRGGRKTPGHIMAALGDKPVSKITPTEVKALLDTIEATGIKPATNNRTRSLVGAIFNCSSPPPSESRRCVIRTMKQQLCDRPGDRHRSGRCSGRPDRHAVGSHLRATTETCRCETRSFGRCPTPMRPPQARSRTRPGSSSRASVRANGCGSS